MQELLHLTVLQNRVSDYLIAAATILVGKIVITILDRLIVGRLKHWAKRTSTTVDDRFVHLLEQTLIPLAYLSIFYLSIRNLMLHPILAEAFDAVSIALATFFGVRFLAALVEYTIKIYWLSRRDYSAGVEQSLSALIPAINVVLWALGIVFLLDNLGFDISAVVAGLGIGGVAVALASQGVLQDLFSYFAILFDRPFELGDLIIVDAYTGTVEQIGIKTTRIKSVSGEEIIVANSDLIKSKIRNLKRMQKRRIVFTISVKPETSLTQLQDIPTIVKTIIDAIEHAQFDRAHFNAFGECSLNFEIVYYVNSSDTITYMNAQQHINLELKREFEQRNIRFANQHQ